MLNQRRGLALALVAVVCAVPSATAQSAQLLEVFTNASQAFATVLQNVGNKLPCPAPMLVAFRLQADMGLGGDAMP